MPTRLAAARSGTARGPTSPPDSQESHRMATDRLTPLDASFLHLEDPNQPMHVGAVMIFEGDAPPYDDFVEHVGNRLAMVPRYRQRLATVPLGQGRPKWTDDEDFDLRFHVRSTALPTPGSEDQLKN